MSPEGAAELFEVLEERPMHRPVMVVCLEGWVDAGHGAATAVATLLADPPTHELVPPSTATTSSTSGPDGRWRAS